MAEHIFQDHSTPLQRRKAHESAQTRCGDLVVWVARIRSGSDVENLLILQHRPARASTQEIKGGIVSDTEQPGFSVADDTGIRQGGEGLDHRILDDVLPIDCGASHARAVSMELWLKLAQQPFEIIARMISHWVSCPQYTVNAEPHMSRDVIPLSARNR